jgi:hypothetical protein
VEQVDQETLVLQEIKVPLAQMETQETLQEMAMQAKQEI